GGGFCFSHRSTRAVWLESVNCLIASTSLASQARATDWLRDLSWLGRNEATANKPTASRAIRAEARTLPLPASCRPADSQSPHGKLLRGAGLRTGTRLGRAGLLGEVAAGVAPAGADSGAGLLGTRCLTQPPVSDCTSTSMPGSAVPTLTRPPMLS